MTGFDRLERDLAVWLEDTAVPKVPDYVDDVVARAVGHRQRPRWTFVSRWLPRAIAGLGAPRLPVRWRTVALLVVLALLLAAVAAVVGSRQRLPPPFGPAANGLVTFTRGGDVFTFDPSSRLETRLVAGAESDQDPMWSLDGTRVAFLRQATRGQLVGFVNVDGSDPVFAARPLPNIDTDSGAWSPDRRLFAVAAGAADSQRFYTISSIDGRVTELPLTSPLLEPHWRPPDGRELMYASSGPFPGLYLYRLDDRSERLIVPADQLELRPRGWSADGRWFVYQTGLDEEGPDSTHILDIDTGEQVDVQMTEARLSNDGTRLAGYRYVGEQVRLCVAPAGGGQCAPIDAPAYEAAITHNDALNWSPNDEWLIVYSNGKVLLIDPDGIDAPQVISADGAASWQRAARP